ncbi:hypothetical protein ACFLZB_02235 [Nanoarchaeota archaeon]
MKPEIKYRLLQLKTQSSHEEAIFEKLLGKRVLIGHDAVENSYMLSGELTGYSTNFLELSNVFENNTTLTIDQFIFLAEENDFSEPGVQKTVFGVPKKDPGDRNIGFIYHPKTVINKKDVGKIIAMEDYLTEGDEK